MTAVFADEVVTTANIACGGGAAVAKLMAELPPAVMPATSSDASRCR